MRCRDALAVALEDSGTKNRPEPDQQADVLCAAKVKMGRPDRFCTSGGCPREG
jgi:hypothetical protein